eukprot:jgi/Tetstr1/442216/TSEL_030363.t1
MWTEFYVDEFDEFRAKSHVDCICNYNNIAELKNRACNLSLAEHPYRRSLSQIANSFARMDQIADRGQLAVG